VASDHLTGSLVCLLAGVARHDSASLADHHLLIADLHRHVLAHQRHRHAVPVALHLDAAILGDTTAELLLGQIGRLTVQRQQRPGLIPLKPHQRLLARGAVDAHIGDLPVPPFQMALHLPPGVKAVSGKATAFHVPHAALILPLGLRPVRPASLGGETPVAGKGGKGGIDHQLTSSWVVESDQRLGVIDQNLLGNPSPEAEGLLQRLQPVALLLLPVHPD
jgi:hypothetical protein